MMSKYGYFVYRGDAKRVYNRDDGKEISYKWIATRKTSFPR